MIGPKQIPNQLRLPIRGSLKRCAGKMNITNHQTDVFSLRCTVQIAQKEKPAPSIKMFG
jgi:hypothetical protein